jgi:hypothetical protein
MRFGLSHAASMDSRPAPTINRKYWEIIVDNLSKAGWSCVSAVGSCDLAVESVVLTQDQPKSRSLIIHQ